MRERKEERSPARITSQPEISLLLNFCLSFILGGLNLSHFCVLAGNKSGSVSAILRGSTCCILFSAVMESFHSVCSSIAMRHE